MVHYADSMVAAFVDHLAQTPVVVQCAQAAPESWLKWLLPTIVQTVVSMLSIFAGVAIAIRSFRANTRSEQRQWERNQRAAHGQWTRDQRKAEWKELLQQLADIEHKIPVIITGIPDHKDLEPAVMSVLPLLRGTIFINQALESSGFIARWQEFLRYVSGKFFLRTSTSRAVRTKTLGEPVTSEDFVRWSEIGRSEEQEVRDRFHSLISELRALAGDSLAEDIPKPSS